MIIRRRRGRHEVSFEMRLIKHAQVAREAARRLPPGKKRETLLRQARANEMAVQIEKWITSPGLRPPE
jgi:hypothetical protein